MLEQAVALPQLADLGFFGLGESGSHTIFDLGDLHPAVKARLGDAEVLGDPRHRASPLRATGDGVAAELLGERCWHGDLPSGEDESPHIRCQPNLGQSRSARWARSLTRSRHGGSSAR